MEDAYVLQLPGHKFHDLHLCFCGYAKCDPLHSFGPAVRPNYVLHYILKGKGRYCLDGACYDLQAGQGFLIEPQIQTFYQADQEDPWTYLWVGFDGNHAEEYLKDLGINSRQLTFRCSHGEELKQLVIRMLKNHTSSTANQFLLESLLYSFFSVLAQDIDVISSSEGNGGNRYIRSAIEYVHNYYSFNIKVSDIADYVCIDRSYLYKLFRQGLNLSPQEYLSNYRLTRAAELLSITDLPVGGVALSCGYKDPLVFGKAFKAKHGTSPAQYRKKSREEAKERLQANQDLLEKI